MSEQTYRPAAGNAIDPLHRGTRQLAATAWCGTTRRAVARSTALRRPMFLRGLGRRFRIADTWTTGMVIGPVMETAGNTSGVGRRTGQRPRHHEPHRGQQRENLTQCTGITEQQSDPPVTGEYSRGGSAARQT